MTTPLRVACDALREDAKKWSAASDEVGAASGEAKNLVLDKRHFGWAGEQRGVVDAYTRLQDKLTGLLAGASTEFDKVAKALRQTADHYQQRDEANAEQFTKVQE